jgi:uncharacterized protein YcfJ
MARRKRKEKTSNIVASKTTEFDVYKKGAFIGGIVGGIAGFMFGRKILIGIFAGSLLGGYLSYEINKVD